MNTLGSYTCQCNIGFQGDGTNCTGWLSPACRISSVFSPMQYIRVHTCIPSLRQDARWYCSNWCFDLGHSSGFLKSNEEGDCKRMLAIPLLIPCSVTNLAIDWPRVKLNILNRELNNGTTQTVQNMSLQSTLLHTCV